MNLIKAAFIAGKKRLMVVAPPGSGKGTIIAYAAAEAVKNGKKVLIFMHKRELVIQQGARIIKQFGFTDIGYYLSGTKQTLRPIMIGTVQTMANRKLSDFDLIIIDEGHRVKTKQHQDIYNQFNGKFKLSFTATPFRGDKKSFEDDFDDIIQFTTYNELVSLKALVPTKVISPKLAPNVDGVHIRGNEFVDNELFDVYDDDRIYKAVVEKWLEFANGKKTIVFNINNKEHSQKTAEYFRKYNIDARAIDCSTPTKERSRLLKEFEENRFPVLCNIGLFTEGISIDDTECIVFNVATKMLQKWVQAGARGSRPVFNKDYSDWLKGPDGEYVKPHCLIIDFGHNCERHGFIDDYDQMKFNLSGRPKATRESPVKTCPECELTISVQRKTCPECGYVFNFLSKENKVFSDEVEWGEVNRAQKLAEKYMNMNYSKLEKSLPGPHLLRFIGVVRNYQPNWAVYQAYKAGYVTLNPAEGVLAIEQIKKFLEQKEKEQGYHNMYLEMKNKFSNA